MRLGKLRISGQTNSAASCLQGDVYCRPSPGLVSIHNILTIACQQCGLRKENELLETIVSLCRNHSVATTITQSVGLFLCKQTRPAVVLEELKGSIWAGLQRRPWLAPPTCPHMNGMQPAASYICSQLMRCMILRQGTARCASSLTRCLEAWWTLARHQAIVAQ